MLRQLVSLATRILLLRAEGSLRASAASDEGEENSWFLLYFLHSMDHLADPCICLCDCRSTSDGAARPPLRCKVGRWQWTR